MKITPKIAQAGISSYEQGFQDFFKTLRPSLKLWDFFVNWDKVFANSRQLEIHLHIWNYLLGKPDFDAEFRDLLRQHPEIVKAIPSLIVRDGNNSETFLLINEIENLSKPDKVFDFSKPAVSHEDIEGALTFVKNTGLVKLFSKDGVKNLVDYIIGVEAGLDSNGRKNRSGSTMESVVESYLDGFVKGRRLSYIPQATPKEIEAKWGFRVPVDKASRSFDFAVTNGQLLVLMEVNFYGGGGSKLKATAGEYKGLHDLLKIPNVKFVWITDGDGWKTTKLPLKSAYEHLDYLWNLDWLSRGYLDDLFE